MSAKSSSPDLGVADLLRRRIGEQGSIRFEEFMACALYDPCGGYYATSEARTGREGDFFTSVSVGPVFGRLLAAQIVQMWESLGNPNDFILVEQGASNGQLMADILAALDAGHPEFRPHTIIIESLRILRKAQEKTLQPWFDRVSFVESEAVLPEFTGVFYSNELLDAFPVRLFVRDGGEWFERCVVLEKERFAFSNVPLAAADIPEQVLALPLPSVSGPYQVEFRPTLAGWMSTLAERLQRGWMLLVDYGHEEWERYLPQRAGGTLAAYRHHERMENPLEHPGQMDITAHVDFSAVERAARAAGLQEIRYMDQHHALVPLAARVFPGMRGAALTSDEAREMRALRQLLHPASMGMAFKFFIAGRDVL